MPRAWISIGSNIDRERHVLAAISGLRRIFGDLIISPTYETPAEGFEGDPFLNLVVGIESALRPPELHALMREIETENGRTRSAEKFSARTLDLDLLTYGNLVTSEGGKDLPRDEIVKYAFVLKPLADVAGQELHPQLKQSYSQLWERFTGNRGGLEVYDLDLSGVHPADVS